MANQAKALVILSSGTFKESKFPETIIPTNKEVPFEPLINKPEVSKLSKHIKFSNKKASFTFLTRQYYEEHFRKCAIDHSEDPNKFVTIIEKDRFDSIAFRDRMKTDVRMCGYAKEIEKVFNEYINMTVRERLIGKKIIHYSLKNKEATFFWLDTDKKWKKIISIFQENDMLW